MTTPLRRRAAKRNDFETGLVRSKAFTIIKGKSFFRERIKLASGVESDFYFNMKPAMLDPEGAALIAQMLLDRLDGLNVDYVGGLAMGAVPLVATVAMFSSMSERCSKPISGFVVRKEVKDHGTRLKIEGLARDETLEGKTVAILDDVTTSGGSAMIAVDEAIKAGAKIVLVLAVVDRGEGAKEFYENKGLPFESLFTADEFLNA